LGNKLGDQGLLGKERFREKAAVALERKGRLRLALQVFAQRGKRKILGKEVEGKLARKGGNEAPNKVCTKGNELPLFKKKRELFKSRYSVENRLQEEATEIGDPRGTLGHYGRLVVCHDAKKGRKEGGTGGFEGGKKPWLEEGSRRWCRPGINLVGDALSGPARYFCVAGLGETTGQGGISENNQKK